MSLLTEMLISAPFEPVGKFGYRLELPDLPRGDRLGNPVCSRLYIYEDDQLIGQPHCGTTMVCAHGNGQYVHWDSILHFSTSDNTDPNTNGRRYRLVWSDDLYFAERAQYFHGTLKFNLSVFGVGFDGLKNKALLEVGCGRNHGMSLIAAGFGAQVVAADRYAPLWDEEFHPGFLEFLIRKGPSMYDGFDPVPLQTLLTRGDFSKPPFTFYQEEAESLTHLADESFDYHCSQAALEHFYDLESVADMLYRTAKKGSLGAHLVDFRDHRDFARPLNFLLMEDQAYDELSGDAKYVHGNRVRPHEYIELWRRHGFTLTEERDLSSERDQGYFDSFLPRLRTSGTRFSQESEESLARLSVLYVLKKP